MISRELSQISQQGVALPYHQAVCPSPSTDLDRQHDRRADGPACC
jgi:hypothetical protein